MVNTAVVQSSSPNHITFLLTGDGTVIGPTVTSAQLLAAMVQGPLRNAYAATYANQAAMQLALLGGGADCDAGVQMRTTVNDVTVEINQVSVDVDVDGVTPALPEINITMSDTTGQEAYLTLRHRHSIIQ